MLKGFKRSGRDSGSKSRITSADISSPTADHSNVAKHMKTIPIRSGSSASTQSNRTSKSTANSDKVIKALYNYQAQSPRELSFVKGEFFIVQTEDKEWYDAASPNDQRRGMVPKSYFETFSRGRSDSYGIASSQSLTQPKMQTQGLEKGQNNGQRPGSLYAIVLYDFRAEKSDELTTYAGENLFICAHHNFEWFIAKPIGRLGGPGLVPIGYVSIIDIDTGYATGSDISEDIQSANLPTVQEWKSNVAKYKASNISLSSPEMKLQQRTSSYAGSGGNPGAPSHNSYFSSTITHAAVDSFSLEGDKFWFNVVCELSDGRARTLKRYYEDFYDLQVKLLDTFPAEAGKLRDVRGQWTKRIMPYIPGPVPYVTDSITKKRKEDLNKYVRDLIGLPMHISQCDTVRSLFDIRKNGFDQEFAQEPTVTLNHLSGTTERSNNAFPGAKVAEDSTLTGEELKVYEMMNELSLRNTKPHSRPPSVSPPQMKPTKIKFFYKDDIFALLLDTNITYTELRVRIAPRIESPAFKLYVKLDNSVGEEVTGDYQVSEVVRGRLKILVEDA
ncbi:LAME_0H07844g1_1 [Lachancea meyersii CBS 8951]|uniref:LAME_0H07844g1_1 n=1 Tax=Lachancea meyersii CBS 8951 TaxID=1266667 RepID=A0A1G4KF45_9SACH|nr:LAME_0H07844g1_1 [Lachancea meyersii CBS 8951]